MKRARLIVAVLASMALLGTAWAGSSSSSSSSSSSRSSSSSSSSGFSRPSSGPSSSGGFSFGSKPSAAPAAVVSPPSSSSGGFSQGAAKPATSVPSVPSNVPKASAYDTHVNREMSSKAFEARQAPAFKAAVGDRTYTPQQVQQTRTTYYTTVYRDRYIPPMYGTSYGSFSEQFMWAMMFNAAFAHNHSDDPAYQQWRRDAEQRAATDQKVKDQLAELDRKVIDLAATPRDPNYIPADVPPEAVFADDALTTGSVPSGHSLWFWLAIMLASGAVIVIGFRAFPRGGRFA